MVQLPAYQRDIVRQLRRRYKHSVNPLAIGIAKRVLSSDGLDSPVKPGNDVFLGLEVPLYHSCHSAN